MKLLFVLLALVPILLELAAAGPVSSVDYYGRVFRNSRMSDKPRVEADDEETDDEDDDDEDADDDADDDSIYPPDFEKLFPNPDGKPVGPNSHSNNMNHPTQPQHGRPGHGPASVRGPASLRGPVPQHGPKPHQRGSYNDGPPPSRRDGPPPQYDGPPPSRRQQYDGPPPSRRDGPPPQYDGPPPQYDGPPPSRRRPEYRTELIGYVQEPEPQDKVTPADNGRQLFIPASRVRQGGYIANNYQRQVPLMYRPGTNPGYQNRRVISYPTLSQHGNRGYYPTQRPVQYRYPVAPVNRYQGAARINVNGYYPGGNRRVGSYFPRPSYFRVPTPVVRARDDVSTESDELPFVTDSRFGRIYNPWSRNPLRGDSYNPEYVINPTEMLSRRRFRYHSTQKMPKQRIPLYTGYWGNPRNNLYDSRFHGSHYHGDYLGSQM